jgi:hypothetical protein
VELVEQAGLADAGIARQGDDLTPAGLGMSQALDEEPQLGAPAHEPRRRDGDRVTAQAIDAQPGLHRRGGRDQLEAPREEKRRAAAHDARARLRELDQRVEHGVRRPPGIRVELDAISEPAHHDHVGVDGEARQGPRRIAGARPRARLQEGERDVGGVLRSILLGLEPECRHRPPGGQLVDLAAEALDLVENGLHEAAGIDGAGRGVSGLERHREQGHAPRLPAHAGGLRRRPR